MYADKHQVTSTTQTTVQLKKKRRLKQVVIQLLQFSMKTMTRKERLLVLIKQHLRQNLHLNKDKKYITQKKVVCFLFGLEYGIVNNLFRFQIRLNRKKSLITSMIEEEVEDVNRCIRIVLMSMMMAVFWFTIQEVIQVTLNYQIHDLLIELFVLPLFIYYMINSD